MCCHHGGARPWQCGCRRGSPQLQGAAMHERTHSPLIGLPRMTGCRVASGSTTGAAGSQMVTLRNISHARWSSHVSDACIKGIAQCQCATVQTQCICLLVGWSPGPGPHAQDVASACVICFLLRGALWHGIVYSAVRCYFASMCNPLLCFSIGCGSSATLCRACALLCGPVLSLCTAAVLYITPGSLSLWQEAFWLATVGGATALGLQVGHLLVAGEHPTTCPLLCFVILYGSLVLPAL
jgi:hypothetical protein